ncbi:MAG: HEAT repeat domain-containing protein [Phycisphaerales bacterium]|nr:HEAT repeat domain-containing protein [Phycisphaerales bacterium]
MKRPLLPLLLLSALCANVGCDTISEDFTDFVDSLQPPSPFEAAVWANDFNDPGKQRQGVVLISNAPFGGAEPYLRLYRVLVEEDSDPLVRAAAIRALGRWGEPDDARIIAEQLDNEYDQVRLESAKALQRIHEPSVADDLWRRLVDEEEREEIRIEIAIAIGQYPGDATFQALLVALDNRSLALNLAAVDSLRILTSENWGLDARRWLAWYDSTSRPFKGQETFLYPTFERRVSFLERLVFWAPVNFEKPSVPRGMEPEARSTYDKAEYTNIGEGS